MAGAAEVRILRPSWYLLGWAGLGLQGQRDAAQPRLKGEAEVGPQAPDAW